MTAVVTSSHRLTRSGTNPGHHKRIRLIADACENLPGYLRASAPVQGLEYAWKQASQMQQEWLRETLAQHGIGITDLASN